ncbi:MAG: YicC family protein [Clostridia bacterium]|nr:YicC family protein [Clostridia bacterium]
MANSMTAFGRAAGTIHNKNITVELKSVNSRYLDPTVKISRPYSFLEEKVKAKLSSAMTRGKVEIYVGIEQIGSPDTHLALDRPYLENYLAVLNTLKERYNLRDDISVMQVAQNKEIFTVERPEVDMEAVWAEVVPFLDEAIAGFQAQRAAEGERLKADLMQKKAHLMELVTVVAEASRRSVETYHDRFVARIRQIIGDLSVEIDESRILTECAIYTDKVAIDEELVRLSSHFVTFDEIFESTEPIGRKLDFLLQEMNRETNTIGSKCIDADIAKVVVEMKSELEKIREQIQNLE